MRRDRNRPILDTSKAEAALDALDADGLRALVREMLPWFDDALHARVVNALVERACRSVADWAPESPGTGKVREIRAFASAALRAGYAEPHAVDACLCEGVNAFLARNYAMAREIYRAVLVPAAQAEFDIGQDELIEEVLGVNPATCAAQYVISVYMTATSEHRGEAVLSAIDEMRGIEYWSEPLRTLEQVATEPLPDFGDFLVQWKSLVAERLPQQRSGNRDSDEDRWLREVVQRMQGAEGLARLARASHRDDDLRAWCLSLIEAGDWSNALAAHVEAASLISDNTHARGHFLDGAALAAQELGSKDLPVRLECAWREAPDMVRLRRWLGSATSRERLSILVHAAHTAVPATAHRQRALLHLLDGSVIEAAGLLSGASGLGWSSDDHPGRLLFPVFQSWLEGVTLPDDSIPDQNSLRRLSDGTELRLLTPGMPELLQLAGVQGPVEPGTRSIIMQALRSAAERRIAGVTAGQRRGHYAHAASLALTCAGIDDSPAGRQWFKAIRLKFRRYPAMQRELNAPATRLRITNR